MEEGGDHVRRSSRLALFIDDDDDDKFLTIKTKQTYYGLGTMQATRYKNSRIQVKADLIVEEIILTISNRKRTQT